MFKKIVSRISFSPALVAQLGFYAKRLRKEQATRRLGLIFVALALVVQSLVVFRAPEPANAAHASDMVPGGLGWTNPDINRFLALYDSNSGWTKSAADYFGITRADITAARYGTFKVGNKIGWGWDTQMPGTTAVPIKDANGTHVRTLYGRTINHYYPPSKDIPAFIGYSERIGWFAINVECGNIVTDVYAPKPLPAPAKITASKTGVNITQGKVDATKTTARENDVISYTVSAKNEGGTAKEVALVDTIADVLKFSQLTDAGGGTLDTAKGTLTWPSVTLAPAQSVSKTYRVKMNASLVTDTDSCTMQNVFLDKNLTVKVGCSTPPANIVVAKTATNVSQGNTDATKTTAMSRDRITYTLVAENTGGTAKEFTFEDHLSDTLEYATLIDNGGATVNEETGVLLWPAVTLKPGAKEIRTITVQVAASIPSTPTGLSQASSYNCKMENAFSVTTTSGPASASTVIPVDCPAPKVVIEQTVQELPKTGAGANIIFASIVLALAAFFYFRSRQLGTEVRLIRRNINEGVF